MNMVFRPRGVWPGTVTAQSFFTSADEAAAWLANTCSELMGLRPQVDGGRRLIADPTMFKQGYRETAKLLHPDNLKTGNTEKFRLLQAAKELIEKAVPV